ncbi:MAG: F0F1 ATP synthase subunit B [Holophaga sp.]|nr:F0F1 ATP synthase subunit B [Holophaga sp.]
MKLRPIALLAPFILVFALTAPDAAAMAQAPHPPAAQTEVQGQAEAEEGHAAHPHHPDVVLFGQHLGTGAQFGVTVFNFILFAGLLWFLLKGALSSAFKARSKELEEKLSQAERDKAEAGRQIQELEDRMAGLQQELEGIMAKADADAEAEKQRILESAKAESAQILLQTRAEIDAQARQAEAALRALVSELAVTGAARRLEAQVQGPVADQVMDQAIDQVGGAK